MSLRHVIAAAGGVTSKDRQIPLSPPRGGIQRCQATYAKLLQAGIAKGGAGCKRSVQSEQLIPVSADHSEQHLVLFCTFAPLTAAVSVVTEIPPKKINQSIIREATFASVRFSDP